jgi:hypothetical protein
MQDASRSLSALQSIRSIHPIRSINCIGCAGFSRRVSRPRALLLTAPAILLAASALAQAPPILNSPYVCANGIAYTVTTCKPYRADQWCETTEMQNGRLVTTMDSAWSQMTGRLAGCTNVAGAKPAAAVASPSPSAAPAAMTGQTGAAAQQSFNPFYLKEFPTVDQIMKQLKGASAQDTAYRQLSALHEFGAMIAAMAGPRMAQNQLTPDETRIVTNYFNAYNALAKSTTNPQDAYINKPDFITGLFTTFNMPTIRQIWQSANSMTASQQPGATPLAPSNDPTTMAARRCVELGGTTAQCMASGLGVGLQSLIGINTDAMTSSGVTGPVMFGSYKAANGLTIAFNDSGVDISGCGSMVQGGHSVTMQPSGSTLLLKIDNRPQPLQMTLGADGKLTGPASQDITGQKITGYLVTTNLKTGASVRNPNYGPDTEHCNVGTLLPGPPSAPPQGAVNSIFGAIAAAGALVGANSQSDVPKQVMISPGPRMAGTFASADGLKIQFSDGGAVIDCAQAHVAAKYSVAISGSSIRATVRNGTSPFTLALGANGTLGGTGTTTVNGKLMTALDSNSDPILTPTSATCPVGTLTAAK